MSGKSKEILENLTHEVSQLNNYLLNLDIDNCDISKLKEGLKKVLEGANEFEKSIEPKTDISNIKSINIDDISKEHKNALDMVGSFMYQWRIKGFNKEKVLSDMLEYISITGNTPSRFYLDYTCSMGVGESWNPNNWKNKQKKEI